MTLVLDAAGIKDSIRQLAAALEAGVFSGNHVPYDTTPAPTPPKWWLARDNRTSARRYNRLGSFVMDGVEIPGGKGKRRLEEQAYLRAYAAWYHMSPRHTLIIRPLSFVYHRMEFRDEKLRLTP